MCGLGIAASILVGVNAVRELIAGATSNIILDVYLVLFALVGLAAELRMFEMLRGLMFYIVKYVYFVTRPVGRGIFYLFVASLSWSSNFEFLPTLTAIAVAVVAVLVIAVDLCVGLPVFTDKEVQDTLDAAVARAATDHAMKQVSERAAAAAACASASAAVASSPASPPIVAQSPDFGSPA